ncbi:MAG: hypothetical protein R3292_02510 [Alcanivorax sp.]|nr:hypothetical protein [Alcanivorax sp.]
MDRENTYQSTAYSSQAPRDLPKGESPDERGGYFTQAAYGVPLNLPGAQCREYIAEAQCDVFDLDKLQEKGPDEKKCRDMRNPHLMDFWPTLFEWPVMARTLCYVSGWFAFVGGGGGIILSAFLISYKSAIGMIKFPFFPLFIIWLFFKIITRDEPKLKKDTRFYRRTGMVSIYQKGEDRLEVPFDEFAPHLTHRTGPTGSTGFLLQLVHRYSDLLIQHVNVYNEEFEVYLEWERLHQFMDISQPIPDRVITEPARQFDPVTADYDKKHNRPKHFWRDMSDEEFEIRREAARKAAKEFPWGKTREQAIASGWKPSEQRIDWKTLKEKQQIV